MFYYVDKFILLSSGTTLYLYKYYLDFSKDDLKRWANLYHVIIDDYVRANT